MDSVRFPHSRHQTRRRPVEEAIRPTPPAKKSKIHDYIVMYMKQARETGICPIREELYKQCFDEVIRQVAVNCSERGMLLLNIRNEMHMTIKAYQVQDSIS